MKILWLCGNPGKYNQDKGQKVIVDGSWISSLQESLLKLNNKSNLALCFIGGSGFRKEELNGTTYYPLAKHSFLQRFNLKYKDEHYLNEIKWVVDDFNPDIIEVFGSETMLGLVYKVTNIPIILHIQGILNPYTDAWYPPLYSRCNVKWTLLSKRFSNILANKYIKYATKRECDILKHIHYYFGRTEWDECVTKLLSPNMKYFYCSEMLRPVFLESEQWKYFKRDKIKLITTISGAIYKGQDTILKTALMLKNNNILFEWNVCGIKEMSLAEHITGIKHENVNVNLCGRVSASELKELFLDSTAYVHLSYIDNSPNSVCEAQILGIPVIAANVGGISSLIKDRINGILVPANDRYMAVTYILRLAEDPEFANMIGGNGHATAMKRHNPDNIIKDLIDAYKKILSE